MKMDEHKISVQTAGVLSEQHFGISANDQAHIIGILRNRLYSDKIMAVLREYGTNAMDAHVESGCVDKPISVRLPSVMTPELSIRDYGPGISEQDIYGVYTQYGNSTKRGTNKAVGMLGIGCKSGFAYTDAFQVISYCNGMKKSYTAYIDESNLGKMTKLAEEPSSEPSGIEIKIPVQAKDIRVFGSKAISLFKHFIPQPQINIQLPKQQFASEGTGWKVRADNDNQSYVIMGHIAYPIRGERLQHLSSDLRQLINSSINFYLPIGSVDIAATREDLEYTDKTIKAIQTAMEFCFRELSKNMRAEMDKCTTGWEARHTFQKLKGNTDLRTGHRYNQSPGNTLRRQILNSVKIWRGVDLSTWAIKPYVATDNFEVRALKHNAKSTVGYTVNMPSYRNTMQMDRNVHLALVDVSAKWVACAMELQKALDKANPSKYPHSTILLLRKKTDGPEAAAEMHQWLKSNGIDGAPIFKLSDYPAPANVDANGRLVRKHTRKRAFKLKWSEYKENRRAASDNWESTEVDFKNDKGVYVPIYRFVPTGNQSITIEAAKKQLKSLGFDITTMDLHGFKGSEVEKLGPGWVKFDKWFEQKVASITASRKAEFIEARNIQNAYQALSYCGPNIKVRIATLKSWGLDEKHPLMAYYIKGEEMFNKYRALNQQQRESNRIKAGIAQQFKDAQFYDPYKEKDALVAKYPMLQYNRFFDIRVQHFHGRIREAIDPIQLTVIKSYIELVDKQE